MTTLIISDIHEHILPTEELINKVNPDKVVVAGDTLDQFGSNIHTWLVTRTWLKKCLDDPKYTFLWGNHDLPYFKLSRYTYCPGYSEDKSNWLDEVIEYEDWLKFKWYTWVGDFLVTHAGLTAPMFKFKAELADKFMRVQSKLAWAALKNHEDHWFYHSDYIRGGDYQYGGIVWSDASNYIPTEGLKQIFGHTPVFTRECIEVIKNNTYRTDVLPKWYITHNSENNEVTIHDNKNIKTKENV